MQALQAHNIMGVDISNHQGNVDFSKFKAQGIQFVYVKASEGSTFKDPYLVNNVTKANAAGIPVGAYHFARPDNNSADKEAQWYLSVIKGLKLDLCPVLDIEVGTIGANALVGWIKRFREIVENELQMRVILYTGKWFADMKNGFNNALADMPLWYANYTSGNLATVQLPNFGGWTDWTIWQFTDKGAVVGVNGGVDMNYARSLDAIRQSLKPQFNVYQNDKFLRSFVNQADAVSYAKQWENASVVRISDNEWIWDNYKQVKKDEVQMDKDAIQKVIAILGSIYSATNDQNVQEVLHQSANFLRTKAGLPTT